MANRKKQRRTEFRPDPPGKSLMSRLYLTRKQRLHGLQWLLFSLLAVLLLAVQDVIFSRMDILGATTDLVPAVLLLVCVLRGPEEGGLFTLLGALVYTLSGSAPSAGVILVLTVLGLGAAIFRQGFLRKGFRSTMLCAGVAVLGYELIVFALGLFLGRTIAGRAGVFLLTGLLSGLAMPVLYPIVRSIDRIGGETWKE